ncbi:MAG: hypothetical protein IJH91_04300 [Mogibacterium sp.]|nr:hypothetical protein [Mogibacterium sp.]
MEFGWISVFGAVIVILMMIPNIIYAIRNKDEKNQCTNQFMNVIEQIGRYACIILMWMPLFVWKFGFSSVYGLILYLIGNGCLLVAYWIIFAFYMKKRTRKRALALAVLPTCIFLLSGLLLRHWLLVGCALLFGVGHIYVTQKNVAAADV